VEPQIDLVSASLPEIVGYFGHKRTIEAPAPGIGLTYGETIGALHQMWKKGYIEADFKAEQDRVLSSILRAQKVESTASRPEFDRDIPEIDDPTAPDDGDLKLPRPVEGPKKGGDTVPR
jgi:hypothetical protein